MDNKGKTTISDRADVNQEARKVIEQSIRREKEYKEIAVKELLQTVNEICEENGLTYFAMGKLLTWCMFGEDSYPETKQYFIALMRKDYDVFLQKLQTVAEKKGIKLSLMYDARGFIRSLNTYVSRKKVFQDELGKLELEISFRIEPYDFLPEDMGERQQFMKTVAERTRRFRADSRSYKEKKQAFGAGRKAKLKSLPFVLRSERKFLKEKKEYGQLVRRNSGLKDPKIAGRVEILNYPAHELSEIYPVSKRPFSGTELMIPSRPEEFMLLLREEEEKKAAQGRFETMKSFDQLCRENQLAYVAMKDLAIACAHHADDWPGLEKRQWYVGMVREDYERLLPLLYDAEASHGLIVKDAVNEYPYIRSNMTGVMREEYAKRFPGEKYYLLYILPLDAVPCDYEESRSFLKDVMEGEAALEQMIDYEKGLIWEKPETAAANTQELYDMNQENRKRYNKMEQQPEQVFTVFKGEMKMLPCGELFPVTESPFHDFSVMCPNNAFFWHQKKDEEYTEYLAAEKTKLLSMIDDLMLKHDLSYFAVAQLLIGAVIYHDAVPESGDKLWDIGLLRKDYEPALKLLREQGKMYGLELYETLDREGRYPLKTKYITHIGGKYSDIRIRLLAFDKVPEDYYLFQGFQKEMDQKNKDYADLMSQYKAGRSSSVMNEETDEAKKLYLNTAVPAREAEQIEKLAQSFNDDDRTHTYRRIAFTKSKMVTEKELFPLQRVKFRNIEINCPNDTSIWQPVLDDELARQVSRIQEADLLLIREFDRVCRELGLGYFICGGTMLGYMRHGGFIPWDDDVDCAMLRADYDRFIAEAGPLLKEKFFLQTRETDPNIPYLFSKIRLDDTEYITKYNEKRDFHKGICLDIFPFDYLPKDRNERKMFVKEVRDLATQHHIIAGNQYPMPDQASVPRNEQEERYIQEQTALLKEAWTKDLRVSQKKYLDAATRYNSRAEELGLETVGSFVPTYTFIDLKDLLPYQRGTFENLNVSVPKRPDIFLKMQYGDYMKMPPKHDQVAHRLERWSTWEDSGSRYPNEEV